jgi:hypothetical protein
MATAGPPSSLSPPTQTHSSSPIPLQRHLWAGDVTQWYSTCLARLRPWVQSAALQQQLGLVWPNIVHSFVSFHPFLDLRNFSSEKKTQSFLRKRFWKDLSGRKKSWEPQWVSNSLDRRAGGWECQRHLAWKKLTWLSSHDTPAGLKSSRWSLAGELPGILQLFIP